MASFSTVLLPGGSATKYCVQVQTNTDKVKENTNRANEERRWSKSEKKAGRTQMQSYSLGPCGAVQSY